MSTDNILDYVSAGVTDGVTVGHPCCSIRDCTVPLASQQHQYCPTHVNHQLLCCVENCIRSVQTGHRTCDEPSHRAFEISKKTSNSAMSMLRGRLVRAGLQAEVTVAGNIANSITSAHSLHPTIPNATGNNLQPNEDVLPIKGRLSRRWTHNEQLFVRCCDVITSRATFFGSEGVSGVKVLILSMLQVHRVLMLFFSRISLK